MSRVVEAAHSWIAAAARAAMKDDDGLTFWIATLFNEDAVAVTDVQSVVAIGGQWGEKAKPFGHTKLRLGYVRV
jgi:hypothetical protein